jgi:alpha-L-rhamnosidase
LLTVQISLRHGATTHPYHYRRYKNGSYASGLQTELSLPLFLRIAPTGQEAAVLDSLISDIIAHDYHVTTGIIGTRALYEVLGKHGRVDVALKMLAKTDFPSYGFMVDNPDEPATTLWEKWVR